jgi:Mg2+ and Co2+ transporter CorA
MHKNIDRIYELSEYMRFHSRSFKKLLKLRDTMHKSPDDESDPIWDEMDDAVEDLDQYSYYMDTLKERFLNLIELVSKIHHHHLNHRLTRLQEFIENANQSDYSRFLSILAALYLPITYLTVCLDQTHASQFR